MTPGPTGRSAAAVAERRSRMVQRLRAAGGRWVTAQDLAAAAEVTPRSIRSYVAEVNRAAAYTAIESTALGYRLLDPDRLDVRAIAQDPRSERQRTVLRTIALTTGGVSIYDLADALHVGESTIESDLTKLRRTLAADGVRLERTGERVALGGSEVAVHKVVARLVRHEVSDGVDVVSVLEEVYPRYDVRAFAADLDAALDALGFEVNDYGFASALLHIVIRVEHGGRPDKGRPDSSATTSPLPAGVAAAIDRHFGAVLDEAGTVEVWRLLDVRALSYMRGVEDHNAAALLTAIRRRLETEHGARIEDIASLDRFRVHLASLLRRIDAGGYNDNPWSESMRAGYPMLFELAATAAHEVALATGVTVPEGEVGFLAFHLGASLHAQSNWESPITVAVYSPRYHDVGTIIADRITRHLAEVATVTVVTSRPETAAASGADIVVSTERLAGVPATVVTPLYSADDAAAVKTAVEQASSLRRAYRIRSTLLRCFEHELFLPRLQAADATDAIRQLGAALVAAHVIEPDDVEGTLEREHIASTAFLEGFAMPHAFGMRAHRTAFAVGLAPTPIPWGGKHVQVVIMLAVAHTDRGLFRGAMDELARLLLEPGAIATIHDARDHTAFLNALQSLLDS